MKEISNLFRGSVHIWLMKYIYKAYSLFKNIKQAIDLLFEMTLNWIYVLGLLFPWFEINIKRLFHFLQNSFEAVKYVK